MASIASQVNKLKSMARTAADVEEIYALLGKKSEFLDKISVSRIPSDGKVHVFLKKFSIKGNKDVCCVKSFMWVHLTQYKHTNATVNDIVDEETYEDHIDTYHNLMRNVPVKHAKHPKMSFKNWQKYAVYLDSVYNTEFNDDVTGDCSWESDCDHKDPGYFSFAKIPVFLYFRKSTVEDIQGDEVDIFFEGRSDILTCDVKRDDGITLHHSKTQWNMEELESMSFLVCKA
jgi:hypothetical protein